MPGPRPLVIHCEGPFHTTPAGTQALPPPGEGVALFAKLQELQGSMEHFMALLDVEEQARAARFHFGQDRERFVIGHGLLREVLGHMLGRPGGSLKLLRGPFGKPYLAGHPVHFNLSDTKDAVLLALARTELGADVETMNRRTDHERVAHHYFTPAEVEQISHAANGKKRFLELWTRKEAVLKACGVGLMDDLHSLEVHARRNELTIQHPEFVKLAGPAYHVTTFAVGEDHVVSLATAAPMANWKLFAVPPIPLR